MDHTEQRIASALAGVLEKNIDEVSLTDDFSSQGLDSLLALRLLRAIEDEAGAEIEPETLFDYPTIRQLADAIDAGTAVGNERADREAQ